jgi:hypothetical protein
MSNKPTDHPFPLATVVQLANLMAPSALYNCMWEDNVIHPMVAIFNHIPPGRNHQPAEVATLMMRLWAYDCVQPVKFNPTHSQAAFMGWTPGGNPQRFNKATEPDADSAAAWEWRCTPTAELLELLKEGS